LFLVSPQTSDDSTQSLTQTQANTTQQGSPDPPNVPPHYNPNPTPEIPRRTLAPKKRAEQEITDYQRCVLNAISNKPDEEKYFL